MFAIWIDSLSTFGTQEFEDRSWRWCRLGPGPRIEGEGDFAQISRALESEPDEVALLVAARECLDLWLKVPPMTTRRIRQAIPFIAEERVAQPIEAMHFALGERRAQRLRCIAISRTLLQTLLDTLGKYGISPSALYSDAALMRVKGEQICILKDGGRALVRTSDIATEVPLKRLPILLGALRRSTSESESEVFIEIADDDGEALSELIAQPGARIARRKLSGTCLTELLPGPEVWEVNLLTGEFEPRASSPRNQPWSLPLAFATALIVVIVASDLVVGHLAQRQVSALVGEATGVYREAFPSARPSQEDLVQVVRREQGNTSQETLELLVILDRASGMFSAHGASVRSLSYQSGSGAIDVEVLVPGYDILDAIEGDAADSFGEISMLGATQTPDGVRARLRLRGAER